MKMKSLAATLFTLSNVFFMFTQEIWYQCDKRLDIMTHIFEKCNILFEFVSFCGRQSSSVTQQLRSRFQQQQKKFHSRLKRRRHCLRICVINSAALARQCGDNLMSSAISVIPRYHLNLERTEMDVRRRPIDQPPPPAVINAVAAIFEVKGFAWARPVTTRAGLPQRRD